MAFIVVVRPGDDPTAAVEKVNRIRRNWHGFFSAGTGGRGSVWTRLVER